MAFDAETYEPNTLELLLERDVLWKLADVIERLEPENELSQRHWGQTRVCDRTACGTSACTLGWAAHYLTEELGLNYVARIPIESFVYIGIFGFSTHELTLDGEPRRHTDEDGRDGFDARFFRTIADRMGLDPADCADVFGLDHAARSYWRRELGLEYHEAVDVSTKELVVMGLRHRAVQRCSAQQLVG